MKKVLLILICLVSFGGVAQNTQLFDQGKEAYRAERYQDAINAWLKIVDNGMHSVALYHNLGNAHYKLNNIGPSIYYYEKALRLSPDEDEVINNLAFAQNATVDAIEPLPQTVFSSWYKKISGILSYGGWAVASIVFSMGFVLLFLCYYFSASEGRKRLFFVTSLASTLLFFITLIMAFKTYGDYINDTPAIIFAESSEVKSEPNLRSEIAFTLHEGTKVQIIEEEADWVRIEIIDGKDGWIPASDLKAL